VPYIHPAHRPDIEKIIIPLGEELETVGELNFAITSLVLSFLGLIPDHGDWIRTNDPSYESFNDAVGVLECVKQELYRRAVIPYEQKKCAENGDVYQKNTPSA